MINRKSLILLFCILLTLVLLYSCDESPIPMNYGEPQSNSETPTDPYIANPFVSVSVPSVPRVTPIYADYYNFTKTGYYGTYAVSYVNNAYPIGEPEAYYYVSFTQNKNNLNQSIAYATPFAYITDHYRRTGEAAIRSRLMTGIHGVSAHYNEVYREIEACLTIVIGGMNLYDYYLTIMDGYSRNDSFYAESIGQNNDAVFIKISDTVIDPDTFEYPEYYLTSGYWIRNDELSGKYGYKFLEDGICYFYDGNNSGVRGTWSVDGTVLTINGFSRNYLILGNILYVGDINEPYRNVNLTVSGICETHSFGEPFNVREATCLECGSASYTCKKCGYTTTRTTPARGHSFGIKTITTQPTCTLSGIETTQCEICGFVQEEQIPSLGHLFNEGEVSKNATCTEYGTTKYTCQRCGEERFNDNILPLGHSFSEEWSNDAEYHWYASTCGHDVVSGKTGHVWNDGVVTVEPTHTTSGIRRFECSVCGRTKEVPIPELVDDHSFSEEWSNDAEYHWHASTCGHDVVSGKTGHVWDNGVVTVEPTESETGVILRTCTICGATKLLTHYAVGNQGPAGGTIIYDKGNFSDNWRYIEASNEIIAIQDGVIRLGLNPPYTSYQNTFSYGVYGNYTRGNDRLNAYINGTLVYDDNSCTKTGIGEGKRNTELIVSKRGTANKNPAAMAYQLVWNGYDDWYLPSKDEIELIGEVLHRGGLWSSSEDGSYVSDTIGVVWWRSYINVNGGVSFSTCNSTWENCVIPIRYL